jgi:hypothetical protein
MGADPSQTKGRQSKKYLLSRLNRNSSSAAATTATVITANDRNPQGSEGPRLDRSWLRWSNSMWFGYAIEAIYIVIGTVLTATVVGMLIYA